MVNKKKAKKIHTMMKNGSIKNSDNKIYKKSHHLSEREKLTHDYLKPLSTLHRF